MKTTLFVLLFALGLTAYAQTRKTPTPVKGVEWWESVEDCKGATGFVYYVPRTVSSKRVPTGLILAGLPKEACVQMPLPEIQVKDGWVRQQPGAPYYFENVGGILVPKFRKECLNEAVRMEVLETPTPSPSPITAATPEPTHDQNVVVTGIPSTIAVHADGDMKVSGEVKVIHSGSVDVNVHHSGEVTVANPTSKTTPTAKKSHKKVWIVLGVVAVAAAAGGVAATHHGSAPQTSAPPTPPRPPVVTTLPPG